MSRMHRTCEGKLVYGVQIVGGQWPRGRHGEHIGISVPLHACLPQRRIGRALHRARRGGEERRILPDPIERREPPHGPPHGAGRIAEQAPGRQRRPLALPPVGSEGQGGAVAQLESLAIDRSSAENRGGAADAVQPWQRRAIDLTEGRQSITQGAERPLGHAVDQEVSSGVHQRAATKVVGPIVVVGKPAEGRLHSAEDQETIRKGAPRQLGVDHRGAVRTQPVSTAG